METNCVTILEEWNNGVLITIYR